MFNGEKRERNKKTKKRIGEEGRKKERIGEDRRNKVREEG